MDFPLPEDSLLFSRECDLPADMAHDEVVGAMAGEVAALAGRPQAAEAIRRSALLREREECTFVGQGLAVPHARLQGLPQAAVYIARCPQGIPWPEPGQAAQVIALLVVPEERPELHLKLLSSLVRARLKGLL